MLKLLENDTPLHLSTEIEVKDENISFGIVIIQHGSVYVREQYKVFTTCLCLPFILFSRGMVSHAAFLFYGYYAALITPFLFASFHLSYGPLGQHKINQGRSSENNKYIKVFCPSVDFSRAYIQFMSNYGCQCGREIGAGIHLSCGLIFYLLNAPLFNSPHPSDYSTLRCLIGFTPY